MYTGQIVCRILIYEWSARTAMNDKLQRICDMFCLNGACVSCEEITMGHINRTYKINVEHPDGTADFYMAQAVNTFAFKDPVAVMHNIALVTEHIRAKKPGAPALHFYCTKENKPYFFERDVFWRLYNFTPAVTHNTCSDLEIVRSAGKAFGEFQMLLSDFDPDQLYLTIPDFHNTKQRYRKLEMDVEADPCGKVAEVREELEWLMSVKDKACQLMDMLTKGTLPLRVTHNDTKINNVLFEENGKNALLVIDLDTVMPGLVGFDFGDAIRFAANRAEEDCKDYNEAGVDMNVFRAFTEGFLQDIAAKLTQKEVDTLALSSFVMTTEVAVRFLDDYIIGNPYFKINYPEHNLVRARCQIALAKDMLARMDEMEAIVRECALQYQT